MDLDLDSIVGALKQIKPHKVILFGSYAYGKPAKDSDIDLLVVISTNKTFHERIQQIRPLLPTSKPVDLIVLTPSEYLQSKTTNPLVKEIISKGKVIYG